MSECGNKECVEWVAETLGLCKPNHCKRHWDISKCPKDKAFTDHAAALAEALRKLLNLTKYDLPLCTEYRTWREANAALEAYDNQKKD